MAPPYTVPEVPLNSVNRKMPVLGLGTASSPVPPPEVIVRAVLDAMELGYRHFDTAALYGSEGPLGEAISQALGLGLIKSRDELFITSKLWCNDAHADRVLPALQKSLKNLNLEYIDQYLIHWPISMTPGPFKIPPGPEDLLPLDIKGVWTAMEECQKLGLTKTIGVSNFTCKKLGDLLALAKIPPAVNQVEMNPTWQQKKLIEYCKGNGVVVAIYSPLGAAGAFWGTNGVLESEILKEIAEAKGKSIAQVALRWAYEQGVVVIMKSYNKERLKQNIEIFDWELSDENLSKIAEIPQARANLGQLLASPTGPFKSVEDLWDGEL